MQNDNIDQALLDEPAKSGSVARIFGFLLVAIALGAGGWYFYKSYNKKNYNEVIIVAADDDEVKSKPADPGGMIVDNMDKDVYDAIDKNKKDIAKAEILLPPTEEPINKKELLLSEMALNIKQPEEDVAPVVEPVDVKEKSHLEDVTPVHEQVAVSSGHSEIISDEKAETVRSKEKIKAPVLVAPEIKNVKEVPLQKQEIVKKEANEAVYIKPVTKKEAKAKPIFAKKNDNVFKVQIASFKTIVEAEREWKNMSKRYKMLNNYEHYIVSKEIEGKGLFHRLQVGPFANENEAKKTCAEFKEVGMSCFIIKP
jgi:cell division protein FtsN